MGRRARFADQKRVLTGTAEPLEARRLFAVVAGTEVAFQAGAGTTLADGDGTAVTFALSGPGSGTVGRDDGGRLHLTLRDTTAASAVTISTDAAGDGLAAVGDVGVTGALRSLTARTTDLHGDLTAAGPIRTLWLNAAGDDGNTITAPTLGEVRTNGDLAADVRVAGQVGAIHVGGSASGLLVRAPRIDRFDVRGDLTGAKVLLFPGPDHEGRAGLRRLTVGGVMRASRVNALGDIGAVSAGAMFDSDVVAGVRFEESYPANGVFEPVLPDTHYESTSTSSGDTTVTTDKEFDFTGRYSLGSVVVSGAAADAGGFAFGNSRIAAHHVGGVRLAGVQPENGGRAFGVAGYRVSRVQRHFGGPDGPALTRQEHPPTNRLVVRQLFQPLRFNPGTGTYASAGSIIVSAGSSGGAMTLFPTPIPAQGVQVGTATDHPTAATVWLNADGSYDARGAEGAVVGRDATLAGLALQLVGTPGTSLKIVTRGEWLPAVPVGRTFLSTSVSPEMTVTASAGARYRNADGTEYRIPSDAEFVAQAEALGATAEVLTKTVRKLRDEPLLLGRRFDDDQGLRTVSLSPALTLQAIDERGADASGTATDLLDALIGDPARLGGGQRLSATLHGYIHLTISGLGDGGTAVLYVQDAVAINASGNMIALPSRDEVSSRLTAAGMPPGRHEEIQPPPGAARNSRRFVQRVTPRR